MAFSFNKPIKLALTWSVLIAAQVGFGGSYSVDESGTLTIKGVVTISEELTVANIVGMRDDANNEPNVSAGSAKIIIKSGGKISMDLNGGKAIGSTFSGPVQFGEGAKSSPITIEPATGSTYKFAGEISGHEDIQETGGQSVEMASKSGDYDGDVTILNGSMSFENKRPIGLGNLYVDFNDSAYKKILFKGGTIEGDIHIVGNNSANTVFRQGTINTINGNIYVSGVSSTQVSWTYGSGAAITNYFNGQIIAPVDKWHMLMGSANDKTIQPITYWNGGATNINIYYWCGGINYITNTLFCSSIHVRGEGTYNAAPYYAYAKKRTEFRLQCEKPFVYTAGGTTLLGVSTEDARDVMLTADGVDPMLGQLDGGKAYGGQYGSKNGWTPVNGYLHFSSTTGNKFRFINSSKTNQKCFGMCVGNVSMAFEGKNSTVYMGGTNCTSTGTLSAENEGVVVNLVKDYVVSNDYIWATARWAGDMMVTNGGKIVINDNANFRNLKTITIADANSKIYVTNGVGIVAHLVIDGEEKEPGTWGGSECAVAHDHTDARILGEGVITNAPIYHISGTELNVPTEGIVVSQLILENTTSCTINGGPITIANGGSITSHGAVTFYGNIVMGYTAEKYAPITLHKVTESGATQNSSIVFNGNISGAEDIEIYDDGDVWFRGNNTFDGNLTIVGGGFYADNDNSLGSTNGWTRCDAAQPTKPSIYFGGIITSEPLFLRDPWSKKVSLSGVNVFNGLITLIGTTVKDCWAGGNYNFNEWNFQANSKTYFNGGLVRDGAASFEGLGANSTAEIYWNSDFDAGRIMYMRGGVNYVNNHFTYNGGGDFTSNWRVRWSTWVMNVENAVKGACLGLESQETVKYILNTDQTFTKFMKYKDETAINKLLHFDSTDGHTVTINGAGATIADNNKWFGTALGSASVALTGADSEILIGGASTSSGTLTLSNGYDVVMAPTTEYPSDIAKWSGNIEIYDNSTLTVNNVANFNKKTTTIKFHGDNSLINIPDGVTIMVNELWVGGEQLTARSYDKSTCSHITGDGTLEVRQHGLILLLK